MLCFDDDDDNSDNCDGGSDDDNNRGICAKPHEGNLLCLLAPFQNT